MKFVFPLKQHTPIIHFQHDQRGATLRASELKPKIDRFVLDYLETTDNPLFDKYKKLIGENFSREKVPSKYRIHVVAEDVGKTGPMKFATYFTRDEEKALQRQGITPKQKTSYFGDFFAISHSSVRLEIFSFSDKLVEFIKKVLPYVFAYNNFGSRQSKGFGSFLPEGIDENRIKDILSSKYPKFWEADVGDYPLSFIHSTYQLLKGGVNLPIPRREVYEKSRLFEYMCDKDIRWEKRKIKEELKNSHSDIFNILKYNTNNAKSNRIDDCGSADQIREYRYVRAMLGLAENNEYAVFKNDDGIKRIQIRIRDGENKIERYRSPITFKVFKKKVFLLPDPIGPEMLSREFVFELVLKYRDRIDNKGELFRLKTPDAFDLVDFLSAKLSEVESSWKPVERDKS